MKSGDQDTPTRGWKFVLSQLYIGDLRWLVRKVDIDRISVVDSLLRIFRT